MLKLPKWTTIIMALNRKLTEVYYSLGSTSSTSSTSAAENHEMPKRTDSLEKLPSIHDRDWLQTTAPINKRSAEDQDSLQDSACALEDHGLQEPLSSGLVDPQVQTPPAPGHRVVVTTEDDILSRFEIGKMLGEGGNGFVYEGKRLEDGLEVAVKFVKKSAGVEYINIPGHPTPLPLEVGLLTLVNRGPKVREIIELLDWQDQPDQYILVLERPSHCEDVFEFLDGHEAGFLDERTARIIMAQASVAAHKCCCRGVFHGDIKLENLLINKETHEVKLIDFGCGDFLQESAYCVFCGTEEYCPPEFKTEGVYHAKPAILWSLGVLLFLMVCGRYPEPKDLERIYDDTWSKPDLSNECCDLIRSLLRKNPSQRIDLGKIIFHKWFKPVSEGSDSQRKSSPGEQVPLHSGQGQISAATSERHGEEETSFIIGRKRKRSSRSAQVYDSREGTSSTSSTSVAETHQPFCVGEGNERPMWKMTDIFEKLPSL